MADRALPQRLQRRRASGWRMPIGAVYVGRPGRWGNPYQVGAQHPHQDRRIRDAAEAVALYRQTVASVASLVWLDAIRHDLAGRTLVCWCPTDQPCHGDILLALANAIHAGERSQMALLAIADTTPTPSTDHQGGHRG